MTNTPDWLEIGPPQAAAAAKRPRKPRAPRVAAGTKLAKERGRAPSMQRRLVGKDRIWACDGEYVYFRPYAYENGVRVERANPTTMARHKRFLAAGDYEYVETQDDVEIYRVAAQSALARKGLYLGEISDAEVRRQVAIAACRRDWVTYADALEELFGRLKNRGYSEAFAKQVAGEYLEYLDVLIRMRGGPSPQECAAGLAGVRARRGEGKGRVILMPGMQ